MRVCVIGAGSCGIVSAKILLERGIPFDCFELGSGIGGNWRYENDNGLSAAYASLHINTSRDCMAFSDFPMPASYPDFPHHSQILAYFESYVDAFDVRPHITFRTAVTSVAPQPGGGYVVRTRHVESGREEERFYEAVLVASGHHWAPHVPTFSGTFGGLMLHAHDYRTPEIFQGRRVLVVGVGNSGCDIACDAARVAEATLLSTRRGAHIIPKYLLGRPLDDWDTPLSSYLPLWFRRRCFELLLRLARGRQERYGFPTPAYPLGAEHPTVSSDLLNLVGHGRISVRPQVDRLKGSEVRFRDGTTEAVDVIVLATGYDVVFPFFDPSFIRVTENRLPLYRRVIHPDHPGLFFIGLLQPLGAIMPLAEAQAAWVADLLEGKAGLPPADRMRAIMHREEEKMARRYVVSRRHTMQVDFYDYLRQLRRERRRRPRASVKHS